MTLDEAIEHAEEVATTRCGECAEEHKQLADWLRELKRARMKIDLLKILRDGFKADAQMYKDENARLRELCKYMKISLCDANPVDNPCDLCGGWDSGLNDCAYELQMRELGIEV